MPQANLTQLVVDRVTYGSAINRYHKGKPPSDRRVTLWDQHLPGFALVVFESGHKSWRVVSRVRGRQVPISLGTLAQVPRLADARARARAAILKMRSGINPAMERREQEEAEQRATAAKEAAKGETLGAWMERYLDERPSDRERRPVGTRYWNEVRRTLARNILNTALATRPGPEITTEELRRHLRALARRVPSEANHAYTDMRALFGWCVEEGLIKANPLAAVKMPAQLVERDRFFDDDELRLFWSAAGAAGRVFGPFTRFLLLTGQRRSEAAQMVWDEVDIERAVWTLPGARAKNGRSHLVHLSPLALETLAGLPRLGRFTFCTGARGDIPLASFAKGKARIAARMEELAGHEIAPWSLHDLRRTTASGMAGIGIAPHVIDRVLNHSSGVIKGIAKVYNRFEYINERKLALGAWSRHVEGLLDPAPADNVAEFPRRAGANPV
jgi:integrase